MIASRKVGGAVQRNRAKRVLREAARGLRWRLGIDVVLIARRDASRVRMGAVATELAELAERLDLLVGPPA